MPAIAPTTTPKMAATLIGAPRSTCIGKANAPAAPIAAPTKLTTVTTR